MDINKDNNQLSNQPDNLGNKPSNLGNSGNNKDNLSDQPINVIENQINNLNSIENNSLNEIKNTEIPLVRQNLINNSNNNQNNLKNNSEVKSDEEIQEEVEDQQRKLLGLHVGQWGIISAVVNFTSVVFQLYKTVKSQKAKSFSMPFIFLMTFLNLVYTVLGILTENHGMTFACLVFVLYNLIIVYYYYFGK